MVELIVLGSYYGEFNEGHPALKSQAIHLRAYMARLKVSYGHVAKMRGFIWKQGIRLPIPIYELGKEATQ